MIKFNELNELILPEICLMYKGALFKDLNALLSCKNGVYPDEIVPVQLIYGKGDREDEYKFYPLFVEPPQSYNLDIDY